MPFFEGRTTLKSNKRVCTLISDFKSSQTAHIHAPVVSKAQSQGTARSVESVGKMNGMLPPDHSVDEINFFLGPSFILVQISRESSGMQNLERMGQYPVDVRVKAELWAKTTAPIWWEELLEKNELAAEDLKRGQECLNWKLDQFRRTKMVFNFENLDWISSAVILWKSWLKRFENLQPSGAWKLCKAVPKLWRTAVMLVVTAGRGSSSSYLMSGNFRNMITLVVG